MAKISQPQTGNCTRVSYNSKVLLKLGAYMMCLGFPGGSDSKEYACNAGDSDLILGLGRSPGEGNGYPLQYSYLENSMNRGAWRGAWQTIVKGKALSGAAF